MTNCAKCGKSEPPADVGNIIEIRVELTEEYWMMCDSCIDEFTEWLEE